LLEAGFDRTEATAGVETAAGRQDAPPLLSVIFKNQVLEASFRETVLGQGWATEAELDQLVEQAARLAERNDLFGFAVCVQALGWVDA